MLFNSFEFFVFFPLVVLMYYIIPQKFRWALLLAASYYFYMAWKAEYIILIVISTLIDYAAGIQMSKHSEKSKRKPWLILSICTNLGILMTFKYANFFIDNINDLLSQLGSTGSIGALKFILPMGISFYTFQTMAYSVDVYNGKIKHESHLGYFALYVTYFPQLVAGPIERAENLLHQFRQKFNFKYDNVVLGLKQMLWGLFKKVVIADRLAVVVDQIYNSPTESPGIILALGTYLFAFQIYCDFSGYSDIAIGASRILGIKLMDNFKTPYFSQSISEFWQRWHISLSTWFRDYLYIPLGGNRVAKWKWYRNLIIVFVVSGFWHGANWTFLMWGFLHGAYLIGAIWFGKLNKSISTVFGIVKNQRIQKWINIFITFHLAAFAWIFFRANNIEDAFHICKTILSLDLDVSEGINFIRDLGYGKTFFSLTLVAFLVLIDSSMDKIHMMKKLNPILVKSQYVIYAFVLALLVLAGRFGEVSFIYFQF
ncbi:MAG: alginate O-acetyltransferase complex protein AlgI [Patiriisocius sp.]|jgi:alginate O-acetyltransferase complex protein AlgI